MGSKLNAGCQIDTRYTCTAWLASKQESWAGSRELTNKYTYDFGHWVVLFGERDLDVVPKRFHGTEA